MTVIESRLKSGVLTLKTTGGSASTYQAACQSTNVRIVPGVENDNEDSVEVLCGDTITGASSSKPADVLAVTAIQDFTDPAGFIAFTWAHRGETVEFTWKPNGTAAQTWAGTLTIDKPYEVGGEVNARLTADIEWPIVSLVPPTGFGTGYGSPSKGAAKPGDVFPAEATVSAEDATNAGKLAGLGFVASPTTAWTAGQKIQVGTHSFHWDGTKFAPGAA